MTDRARLEVLHLKAVSATPIVKAASDFELRYENSIARKMFGDWQEISKTAKKKASAAWAGARTKEAAKKITAAVKAAINGFGEDDDNFLKKQTDIFYTGFSRRYLRENGLFIKKAELQEDGKVTFTDEDKAVAAAVAFMASDVYINHYETAVEDKVERAVDQALFDDEILDREMRKTLEEEVGAALGEEESQGNEDTLFATNSEHYFRTTAAHIGIFAGSAASIMALKSAGIKRMRIQAVMDSRTTDICRALHNRIIEVGRGVQTLNQFVGNPTRDFFFDSLPFENDTPIGFSKTKVPGWAASGQGFPPYHMNCRTIVVPL